MTSHATPTTLDSIKKSLVALRMPRALEMLDTTFRKIEQGEIDAIEALDHLLVEEVTIRENRRVKTALLLARLTTIKTIAGFDFTFQPSLDRNRILALAELKFIDRAEVVHLLGPPESNSDCSSLDLLKTPELFDADCQTMDAEAGGPALLG
jgi:DNA replication protein DnaC